MTAPDVPGLADIVRWAGFLNIDVTDTVRKAQMLMQTDPGSVRAGGERLGGMATGLDSDHQNMTTIGTDVLAGGMNGQTADAFTASHADLVDRSAGMGGMAKQLAGELGQMAMAFEQSQQTVVTATGAAATALRMLRA